VNPIAIFTLRHSGQAQREPESRPLCGNDLPWLQKTDWIPAFGFDRTAACSVLVAESSKLHQRRLL